MADTNIIGSLFGVSPDLLQQQQDQTAFARGVQAGTNPLGGVLGNIGMFSSRAGAGLRGALGVQSPEEQINALRQQASKQFDTTKPEGLVQMAQLLNQQGDAQGAALAISRAQALAKESQAIATSRAQEQRALREPGQVNFQQLLSSGKYTPASLAKFKQSENPADLVLVKTAEGEGGLGKLSTAEKAVDSKFGKEYADYYAGGGISNLNKNLAELDRAINIIEKAKEDEVSGKLIGLSDKAGTLAYTHSKAADVKDIIGSVAQSNLRQILGGQFAQKEGEALLARQYDTAQSKKANLNRLKALRKQAANTIMSKQAAAKYFEENGTLKGFKATTATEDDNDPLGLR